MHVVGARTGPPPTVDHIRCRREIAVFRRVGIRRAFEGGVGLGLAGRRRCVAREWLCLTVLPPRFQLEWTRHQHHTCRGGPLGGQARVHHVLDRMAFRPSRAPTHLRAWGSDSLLGLTGMIVTVRVADSGVWDTFP